MTIAFARIASAQSEVGPSSDSRSELRNVLHLFATGGVAGELAIPACGSDSHFEPAEIARRDVWRRDRTASLLVDTGGLLARHGVARFASRRQPEALAQLVRSLGYRALALGEADLGDPRELLLARARALRRYGVPYLATNLRCAAESAEVCETLVTGAVGVPLLRQGDEQIALLSYLDPGVGQRVGPDRMQGLHLEPLEGAIRNGVRAARAAGATLVVAIVDHHGSGAVGAARILNVVAQLAEADKPDVVFAASAGTELLFARPVDFRPAFVAAPTRNAVDAWVRHNGEGLDILARPSRVGTTAPAFAAFMASVGPAYCRELGHALPGGHVDPSVGELGPRALGELVAGVMRDRTGADVAILNTSVIDARWPGVREGTLTASDVNIAVQYDEPLLRATVPALWLRDFARKHADDDDSLIKLGLTIANPFGTLEKIKINGRLLDMEANYDVVTIRYLAEGGDDGAIPGGVEWEQLDDLTLRTVLLDHLEQERQEDPRRSLSDPWEELEWTLRVNSDLTFSGSAVRDPGGYAEGPLQNANQTQFGMNANIALNALSRRAAWENLLTATYTLAATPETDGFDEGADQLVYRTTGNYRGFRARRDELFVPDLVAEGLLRTEFTKADDRDSRFLNMRFAGGLQWRLHLKVKLKLLGGFEILEVTSGADRSLQPGVGAQLIIDPWLLMRSGLRKLTLGLSADYFLSGLGDLNRHLFQGLFDLQLNLNRYLALSFNVNLYGLKEGDDDFSFAAQTNIAVRVTWTRRRVAH